MGMFQIQNMDLQHVIDIFDHQQAYRILLSSYVWLSLPFFVFKSLVFQDYRLPAVAVFNDCVQQLIQKKSYDQIFSLMKTIEGTGMIPDKGRDHLLLKVIKKITSVGEVGILFNSRH